jgi:hypothetical protein
MFGGLSPITAYINGHRACYAAFSEDRNVEVHHSGSYSAVRPAIAEPLGTQLLTVLQWLLVPAPLAAHGVVPCVDRERSGDADMMNGMGG